MCVLKTTLLVRAENCREYLDTVVAEEKKETGCREGVLVIICKV